MLSEQLGQADLAALFVEEAIVFGDGPGRERAAFLYVGDIYPEFLHLHEETEGREVRAAKDSPGRHDDHYHGGSGGAGPASRAPSPRKTAFARGFGSRSTSTTRD